jgi:hypothetical protein
MGKAQIAVPNHFVKEKKRLRTWNFVPNHTLDKKTLNSVPNYQIEEKNGISMATLALPLAAYNRK